MICSNVCNLLSPGLKFMVYIYKNASLYAPVKPTGIPVESQPTDESGKSSEASKMLGAHRLLLFLFNGLEPPVLICPRVSG